MRASVFKIAGLNVAFEWYEPPTQVFVIGTERYIRNIHARVVQIANRRAPEIEEWMKQNHLWINRTGDAEAGLHTEVREIAQQMVEIILAHGDDIDYGIWLEVANGGRFAVIAPAVDMWGAIIWSDVQGMLR